MFDYIRAGRDGKVGDVLKGLDGKMSRVDNAHIIPERTSNDANYIGSSYVANNIGEPLPSDLVERIKQVTPDQYREFLQSRGYSPSASEWAADRLAEVQKGKITGSAWGCAIVHDITQAVVYPPGYTHILQYWMDHPKLPGELSRDEM